MTEVTIFERILTGEIPARKVYEDEHALAFHDIHPQAKVHVLVIPKRKIVDIASAQPGDREALGNVLLAAKKTAEVLGLAEGGYRLVFNVGRHAGQTVFYLHCHILGGEALGAMC